MIQKKNKLENTPLFDLQPGKNVNNKTGVTSRHTPLEVEKKYTGGSTYTPSPGVPTALHQIHIKVSLIIIPTVQDLSRLFDLFSLVPKVRGK